MALISHGYFEGESQGPIDGDCNLKGYEKSVIIYGTSYKVDIPVDVHTGLATGSRHHGAFTIVKAIDRASPLLFSACCEGEHFKKIEIIYKRINEKGIEEKYYSITLTNATCVEILHHKELTFADATKNYHDLENVSFTFEAIAESHLIASTNGTDDWKARK